MNKLTDTVTVIDQQTRSIRGEPARWPARSRRHQSRGESQAVQVRQEGLDDLVDRFPNDPLEALILFVAEAGCVGWCGSACYDRSCSICCVNEGIDPIHGGNVLGIN